MFIRTSQFISTKPTNVCGYLLGQYLPTSIISSLSSIRRVNEDSIKQKLPSQQSYNMKAATYRFRISKNKVKLQFIR